MGDVFKFNTKFITTESFKLKEWDLEKVSKEDLDFSVDFKLVANVKGFVSGLVFWFDTTFSHGKFPIVLDTSPLLESTHWK